MQLQLRWTNLTTGESQRSRLETPIAIGRDSTALPGVINGYPVARLVLDGNHVASYHALIETENNQLIVTDQSQQGIRVNTALESRATLVDGDYLRIGSFEIQVKTNVDEPETGVDLPETGCDRKVGFLFKRRCGRTSTVGCPYCDPQQIAQASYYDDYSYYPGYGHYGHGYWGAHYYYNQDHYFYDRATGTVDFTEADGASFETEADTDYEMDMGAS